MIKKKQPELKYEPNEKGQAILERIHNAYQLGKQQLETRIPAFSNRTAQEVYKEALDAYNIVREDVELSIHDE